MSGRRSCGPASQACMAISWEEAPAPATEAEWVLQAAPATSTTVAAARTPRPLVLTMLSPVCRPTGPAGPRHRLRGVGCGCLELVAQDRMSGVQGSSGGAG